MAELAEWSLPMPDDPVSNPAMDIFRKPIITVNCCKDDRRGTWWKSNGQCARLLSDEPSSNPTESTVLFGKIAPVERK